MQKPKLWNRNLILIILINFFVFSNHFMITSTFPFYIESLGGNEAVAGLSVLLFSLISLLGRPLIGWMLDNKQRKAVLFIGLFGMCLIPIGYMCFSAMLITLIFRMAHGSSLAFSGTAASTIATDIVPEESIAEGMGMFGMATVLATSCAPAVGLALMNRFGYSTLFACAAGIMAVSMVFYLFLKTPVIKFQRKPLNVKELFDSNAFPASAITLTFLLSFGALESFIAKFASEGSLPGGGYFFLVMAAMNVLVRFTLGKVVDRKGEALFVYTGNAAMFIAFLLLAFIPNTITFFAAAILAGYGFGGIEPALLSMAVHISPPERRGAANSTFYCAYDIGFGLGGGIAGALITEMGYGSMFAILSVANILSIAVYHFWGRKHPSSFRNSRLKHD
jgi:MFS family permease